MDGFDTSAATVAAVSCQRPAHDLLHRRRDLGELALRCEPVPELSVGKQQRLAGRKWLDIRQLPVLEPIMTARFQMCQQKGFDAVEPDNMDGYENDTGFPITAG